MPDRVDKESASDNPNKLALPAKTKWRSPPFAIRFPATDQREQPLPPPPMRPSMLMRLLKSGLAAIAILIAGGALLWHYGILQSLRLPKIGSFVGRQAVSPQPGSSPQPRPLQQPGSLQQAGAAQQQREAALRQRETEAKVQQQKTGAFSQQR